MNDPVTIERQELRRIALRRHVRIGIGGIEIPNGGSCIICQSAWNRCDPERHAKMCPLFREE